jgi:microcystin-dependent protein
MSEPFLSEIKMVSFDFPPKGWAFCDGQELPIAQNQALFSLLGNAHGGDGLKTFALPDLKSQLPMHRPAIGGLGQLGPAADPARAEEAPRPGIGAGAGPMPNFVIALQGIFPSRS